jgi:hypothetical protein
MCNTTLGIGIDPYIELATFIVTSHPDSSNSSKWCLSNVWFLEDYFLPLIPLNMIKIMYRCLGLRGSVPILSARDE